MILSLSAGGARGAFQVGVLDQLYEQDITEVYGSSAGALNAAMLACGKKSLLLNLWLYQLPKTNIFNRRSFIKKKLDEYVFLEDLIMPIHITVTDIENGQDYILSDSDFDCNKQFRKAILASASFPAITPFVKNIKLKDGTVIKKATDGGILLPLAYDANEKGDFLVIATRDGDPTYEKVNRLSSIFRSFDLIMDRLYLHQIVALQKTNNVTLIEGKNLPSSFDFSKKSLIESYKQGYNDVRI